MASSLKFPYKDENAGALDLCWLERWIPNNPVVNHEFQEKEGHNPSDRLLANTELVTHDRKSPVWSVQDMGPFDGRRVRPTPRRNDDALQVLVLVFLYAGPQCSGMTRL